MGTAVVAGARVSVEPSMRDDAYAINGAPDEMRKIRSALSAQGLIAKAGDNPAQGFFLPYAEFEKNSVKGNELVDQIKAALDRAVAPRSLS